MLSEIHYVIRSKHDGQYLVARIKTKEAQSIHQYLLVFREQYDALSYLNTHAKDVTRSFAVESLSSIQLKAVIQRWSFQGIGVVNEPLEPQIQFLTYESGFNF